MRRRVVRHARSYDSPGVYGFRGAGSQRLDVAFVSRQDHACHFCGALIPSGTPHKYRTGCVYHACPECEYPQEAGNYQ